MPEQVTKLKKKQWFQLIAPPQFNNVILGETLVDDPKAMLGKRLSHNLMNLTNEMKRQNVNIHFEVVSVEGDKGKTKIIGYQIIPSSVKRFVRRNSEKMDISFSCETSDKVHLRVKPLVISKADVKGSVAAKLRHNIVSFVTKAIESKKYDEILNDLITHKIQSTLRGHLTKIYPVKVCEIRYLGIEKRENTSEEAKTEEASQQEKTPETESKTEEKPEEEKDKVEEKPQAKAEVEEKKQ